MKRIKSILACGAVLALTGLTTALVAAGGTKEQKAIVRSVHGTVQYKMPGGEWMPVKVNMELKPGTELKSEAGADAYLQVNGFTSTIKLAESTDLTLSKMESMEMGDTSTQLKLDNGSVLGSVKKVSANSDYKVAVPNGVAGIRGTDFQVSVNFTGGGNFTVTFTSVTGTVQCQVTPPAGGGQASQTLNSGQSWTVSGNISTTGNVTTVTLSAPDNIPPALLNSLKNAIALVLSFGGGTVTTSTTGNGTTTTTTITATTSGSQTGGMDSGTSQ